MVAWGALLGATLAWTVVLALGAAAGYGLVQAWTRWGAQVTLPRPLRRGVELALGVPAPVAAARAPAPEPVRAAPIAAAPPQAAPAPPPAAMAAPVSAEAPPPTPEAVPPQAESEPEPEPVPEPPRHVLPRADAVTEIATVFHVAYEEAVALLDAGLWGAENFDEWSRSVRGGAAPAGVPDEVFQRVVALTPRDVEATAQQHRAKRVATRELETLWGVGPTEAEALFTAGYRDLASIRKASTDKLAKVPGIGTARAFQIRAAAHGLAPTP